MKNMVLLAVAAAAAGLVMSVAQAQSDAERLDAEVRADARRPAHLQGLSSADAEGLISKLGELQEKLRAGERLYFELLSGAPASYETTLVPPREAFLQMEFGRAVKIERIPTDRQLWQPFKLVLTPDGPGRLIWEVEVVLGFNDEVRRVQMIHRPPPPLTPPPPPR